MQDIKTIGVGCICVWGGNRPGQLTATCGMFVHTSVGMLHLKWWCFVFQLGTFRSSEGEYFVEPLLSYNGEHYEEEHIKPHFVYRKDAHKGAKEDASSCDTAGKKKKKVTLTISSHISHHISLSLIFLENVLQHTLGFIINARHLAGVLLKFLK